MKLYYATATCSLSPHIVLREAGLVFEPVAVGHKSHKLNDGSSYDAINSKGLVPMLELDNGERLTEGPAILQYIADQVPEKRLAPPNGTMARFRVQEWLNFIGSEMHKSFTPVFNPNMPEGGKAIYRTKLLGRFRWVDEQLEGKDYLMGLEFSIPDAYLFTIARWTVPTKLGIDNLPNLTAFRKRMLARPAVQAAMKVEGIEGI